MIDEDVRHIAREAARAAVEEMLLALGLDADEPKETQADMLWLRRARKGSDDMGRYARRSALGIVVPLLLWLLYEGVKGSLPGLGE